MTIYIDWENRKVYEESELTGLRGIYARDLWTGKVDNFYSYLNDRYTAEDIFLMAENERIGLFNDYVDNEMHFRKYLGENFEIMELSE